MSTAGVLGVANHAWAAAFQLWEQDGATVGNYHAGRAAEAADASTGFYNPAGLVRIKNQQIVLGVDPIMTDFKFRGTVNTTAGSPQFFTTSTGPVPTTVEGGTSNLVPFFHYAVPISSWSVFGLSLVAPFGLDINYGYATNMRYALTMASLRVYDLSPSVGVAINDKLSVGGGIDIERARAEFDSAATVPGVSVSDTLARNIGSSNALGFHLGILFQSSENTRYGLSYQSKITHHLNGNSTFVGSLANSDDMGNAAGGVQGNSGLKANINLPATTAFSIFHTFNPTWDVMGTVQFTQWSILKDVILQNVSGAVVNPLAFGVPIASNSIIVDIPQHYRNTWNWSLGANYHVNKKFMLRGGVGYDQTPSKDAYRNAILPDSNRIAVAIGAHLQVLRTLGFDAGWTHLFCVNTRINNPPEVAGAQTVNTIGSVKASADIVGLQMKWDIA